MAKLFSIGIFVGVAALLQTFNAGLPDIDKLAQYQPPVMTRIHAADGQLMAEHARERRLYLPIQAVPDLIKAAFLSAEDKNFYEHDGLDVAGILRAAVVNIRNRGSGKRPVGASTITQQVAKNFLLSGEVSYERKIKEALLALRIEQAYSKDKIFELYLNEIYLGLGSYGIAAAALNYFDKPVNQLTIGEAAYLAALPKAPENYNPFRHEDRAVERRNWVIDRMVENGYIRAADGEAAKNSPLVVTPRTRDNYLFASDFFAEEVRRELIDMYGSKKLYEGGLSVRTTLDPKLQVLARKALQDGLVRFDEKRGYRGPVTTIDISGDWGEPLGRVPGLSDVPEWKLAVVLDTTSDAATIGLQPATLPNGALAADREKGTIPLSEMKWARSGLSNVGSALKPGDVVYVEAVADKPGTFELHQVPEIEGAIIAMDPHTGRVLAMQGGFSFAESEFNRATQAWRQPGSAFKPFVYSAALDNGYTPSSVVMDAPIEIQAGNEVWRPVNYGGKYLGPATLRTAIEKSRNVMTVRLAQDMGMPLIVEYAKRFGIYDNLAPYLPMAHRRRRDHRDAARHRLRDDRRRGQEDQRHADRPHPGPLRPHHLPARPAQVRRLRRHRLDRPAGADAHRQPRAGARPDDRLPDHLHDGGRGEARHGDGRAEGRQADRRQDRHHQRREGRLVRRLLARSRLRRLHRLRQAAADGSGPDRRRARGACLHGVHEGGVERRPAEGIPGAAWHLADPDRPPHRAARAGRRPRRDPRGLQTGDGATDDKRDCLSMEFAG